MRGVALATLVLAGWAHAKTVTYAIAIGNDAPPPGQPELPTLRFADDDAVRFDAFFSRVTEHHWLLSVLDAPTQRRHEAAASRARPPTLSALRALVAELATRMKADVARGDEPVLFLTFSGHGAQASDGTVFLSLVDGALTRQVLSDEVLAPLPAAFVHLFVDACHAEAVVGTRGLFSKERSAARVEVTSTERTTVLERGSLARFPNVGVLMAATDDQESHEWSRLEAGVFTHEVLSALTGAADVNGDGAVEYSEVQAFVVSANRDLKDPRALPHVVAIPPAVRPRVPLAVLDRLGMVTFLEGQLSSLGHFHVELDDGERYLDAHLSTEAPVRLALPAGRRLFIVAGRREALFTGELLATAPLEGLRFQERSVSARGSIEATQREALFQSPFGPTYYRGFVDSVGATSVSFGAREGAGGTSSRAPGITLLVVGGLALGGALVLGGLATQAKHDFDVTELQRPAEEARLRYGSFANAAWVTGVVGALVAGAGAWLTLSAGSKDVTVTLTAGPERSGLALGGRW